MTCPLVSVVSNNVGLGNNTKYEPSGTRSPFETLEIYTKAGPDGLLGGIVERRASVNAGSAGAGDIVVELLL